MKLSRGTSARLAVAVAGGLMLVGTAGAAFAADTYGESDVDVNVDITPIDGPGSLSMTVAGTSATLSEVASGVADVRQFDGTLPTVTVTDTRAVDDIGANRWWYVLGQASDFVGTAGQPNIGADHFGWAPNVIDDEDGLVLEGETVDTVEDTGPNAVGLVGQELLYGALDSAALVDAGGTSWKADASLYLKTGSDVAPGSYKSTLTLSLFEDVID